MTELGFKLQCGSKVLTTMLLESLRNKTSLGLAVFKYQSVLKATRIESQGA